MLKRWLVLLLLSSTCIVVIVACASAGSAPSGNTATGSSTTGNTVHMNSDNFVQSLVTIHKGESLSLMNDSDVPHIIANGSWENNAPKAASEAGAPIVNDVQVASNGTQNIGLFNTAGTFHFYCTIHPGMNLTIVVQ